MVCISDIFMLYYWISKISLVHFFIISPLSFHAENNLDQWYQSRLALDCFFQCMSPTRYEYRKLGLELVSLEENNSHMPKKPSMVEENKNDRATILLICCLSKLSCDRGTK
jgi:hypothetical protein